MNKKFEVKYENKIFLFYTWVVYIDFRTWVNLWEFYASVVLHSKCDALAQLKNRISNFKNENQILKFRHQNFNCKSQSFENKIILKDKAQYVKTEWVQKSNCVWEKC